ncbi:hypothetical protein IQ247_29420 [Plectonema cf. radiosum LEGE 06105]|uniref:Uncharacterized protein n=1 Tax=Plectonema cf. radiosum LEGE 06105 TaxID=945769 RepID=A0A8J7F572_9CYAN|nr:hypothetical protein [Plectonema radiosum]MBE9216726.1 hypothetical protein [Plectonema cf. radiosum LEGE 06105]
MNFSKALDITLDKYGISAKWLSEQTGVSQQMISGFRRGNQRIYSDSLERILAGLPVEARNDLLSMLCNIDTSKVDLRSLVMEASPQEKAEVLNALASWVVQSRESKDSSCLPQAV